MFGFLYSNLKKGITKVITNPQLIYTIIVAVLITGAFIFMAERFVGIARDAQDRLINVRIGSLQDAFVSFAKDKINDEEYLNQRISDIVQTNETIKTFEIIEKVSSVDPNTNQPILSYKIIASNNKDQINQEDSQASFLFTLASSDPSHSVTMELSQDGERLFRTTRAISDNTGNILGAVVSTQTLSLADITIQNNIRNTEILLLFIILLVMFLFLRHSKIIDYMDLYKKLKEVDQLKDDFISMASHELRTPLSIIRGYAEFVNEAPEVAKETKDYISKINICTKELDSLVSDILDVSRIQQGRLSFEFVNINPSDTVEEIVSSLVLPAKEKGLSISFDKTKVESNQNIKVDIGRFKQIFVNIIGNAVKYTLKGEVIVRQYTLDGRLCIRVSDTGLGMSEDERKRLFEKFYRIRTVETENIRGTGLGLWITDQMIKQMNGSVSVESIKGVGSHFIVSFPLV